MSRFENFLRAAKSHLDEGEEVLASVFGAYECKIMGHDTVRNGVWIVTPKRVVFYAKKLMGFDFETMPLKHISSVERSKGLLGSSIIVYVSGNKMKLKWIRQGDVDKLFETIRERMGEKSSNDPAVSAPDLADQVKKFHDLLAIGAITQEEFDKKKSELLK